MIYNLIRETKRDLSVSNHPMANVLLNDMEQFHWEQIQKEMQIELADKLKEFWAAEEEMKEKKRKYLSLLDDMRRNSYISQEHSQIMRNLVQNPQYQYKIPATIPV